MEANLLTKGFQWHTCLLLSLRKVFIASMLADCLS